jgi:serine/threonine protein kinase
MDFCEGATLYDVIASHGRLEEPVVRRIVGQLAAALRYVHTQGVVHRDLKPSNLMLTRSGVVKLLDFGIVARAWQGGKTSRATDAAGKLFGSLRYMAPEQFSRGVVDNRADFYGLACVAYEALCGEPAIAADDLLEIIQQKMKFALPPAEAIGGGVTSDMHLMLSQGFAYRREDRVMDLDRWSAWAGPVPFDW